MIETLVAIGDKSKFLCNKFGSLLKNNNNILFVDEELFEKNFLCENKKIVVVTNTTNVENAKNCYNCGCAAYINKDIDIILFKVVLSVIKANTIWIDPIVAPFLFIPTMKVANKNIRFTQREKEVLELVVQGKNNSEIAQILTISPHTAKAHVCEILRKLNVRDRVQAAVMAILFGYVRP